MSRCLFLALILLPCLEAVAADRALLIGISQYAEIEGLRYADADVKAFSQILVDFGGYSRSDVTLLLNTGATKERITTEVERIVRESKSTPLDHFIFMFAGHGMPSHMEVERVGGTAAQRTNIFLAPFDASTASQAFYSTGHEIVNETFINRAWLAKQLAEIQAKSIIIIVDSCYSGTEAFGDLFFENLGYKIRPFGNRSQPPGIKEYQRAIPFEQHGMPTRDVQKRIAYLASSREDQVSVEYEELGHGALSYCLFEAIRRARESLRPDQRRNLSVDGLYSSITALFQETKVKGRALRESHQPVLLPIPSYAEVRDMPFLSLSGGAPGSEILGKRKGELQLHTDPPGFEVYIDGARQDQVTPVKLSLDEGKHLVEVYTAATGYRHTFTVDISEGTPATEELLLLGRLRVTSFWLTGGKKTDGPVLDVYLDGKPIGKSDQRFDSLTAGTHTLEVRYADYSQKRRIEIRPDSPLVLNYSVVRDGTPAPRKRDPGSLVY